MARYFFHLHDGFDHRDLDGNDLPTLDAARQHAAQYAGELLKGAPSTFWTGDRWTMQVTDERGHTIFGLEFVATGPF